MKNPASSHVVLSALTRRGPRWLRRATLLAGVVLSLAMVGDPAAARTRAPFMPDTLPGTLTTPGRAGLTLALNTVGAIHRSLDQWSDGATESLSLLALGLGLLGAGRVLAQKREAMPPIPAAPDGALEVLKPHDAPVSSIAQRVAR